MKRFLKIITMGAVIASTALFSSCATQTPQKRIEKFPHLFEKLPHEHKGLVNKGEIKKGMTKDAVYLAWGTPDKSVELFKNNVKSTRWEYYTDKPHFSNRVYGSVGLGYSDTGCRYSSRPFYGGYGGYGSYNGVGIGTGVNYSKELSASVLFKKNLVSEWQVER